MLEDRFCTLCGPSAGKKRKFPPNFSIQDLNSEVFSARRAPDRRHFQIIECTECGILYSDPACNPAFLSRLYEESQVNYVQHEDQIFENYEPILERAVGGLKNRGTFLEVGGGRGFMLRFGAGHGFAEQVEIKPSKDAEARFIPPSARSRFVRSAFQAGILPKDSVSLACFFQMLDHVSSPSSFVREIFDVLEPGGAAVCVTHNTQALSAKLLGERSPIFDVEHTYLFSPENMSQLFQAAGFERVIAYSISNRYTMRYWLHLAPLPQTLKGILSTAMEVTGLAQVIFPVRAGNFALIGYKPS